MGDLWEILTTSNNLFAIFQSLTIKKQDKDDFKLNLNLLPFFVSAQRKGYFLALPATF